jgi:hypothetical protein
MQVARQHKKEGDVSKDHVYHTSHTHVINNIAILITKVIKVNNSSVKCGLFNIKNTCTQNTLNVSASSRFHQRFSNAGEIVKNPVLGGGFMVITVSSVGRM